MKLMKKVLLPVLVLSILLASCGQGNGGDPSGNSGSPDNGNSPGNGGTTDFIPEVAYKEPTLPEPSGTDPFEGKSVPVIDLDYLNPDTANRILVVTDSNGQETARIKYTYDAEGNITLYTTHITWPTKQADGTWKDTLVTAKVALDNYDDTVRNYYLKDQVKEAIEASSQGADALGLLNQRFNSNLTEADLTTENLEATLDKLMQLPIVKEAKNKMTQTLSTTDTCLLQTTETEGEIALQYKTDYDPQKPLNAQTKGYFYGSHLTIDFDAGYEYITIGDKTYNMTSVANDVITCTEEGTNTTKTFTYTTEGSGNNTKVIVNVDGIKMTCEWKGDGSYDPQKPLNAQTGGYFYGALTIDFDAGYEYITIGDKTYNMTSVADGVITCTEEDTNTTKTFTYTMEGSGNDTKVIVDVDVDVDGIKVTCEWIEIESYYSRFNYRNYIPGDYD